MALDREKANLTRQYLLGALPDDEASRLEEEFFADDEIFQEIEIAEDDLVDAYVRGKLSETEHRQFEENLGKLPRLAERVKFAKVLENATRIPPQPNDVTGLDSANPAVAVADLPENDAGVKKEVLSVKHDKDGNRSGWKAMFAPWLTPAGMATAPLVLLVGSFLIYDSWRLRKEIQTLQAQQQESQRQNELVATRVAQEKRDSELLVQNLEAENETLKADAERLRDRGITLPEISWDLYPSGYRGPEGGGDTDHRLPAKPSKIVLRLALESDDYSSYTAVITRVGESRSEEKRNLTASDYKSIRVLTLRLSSTDLQRADYTVTVTGVRGSAKSEVIATYTFRIV